MRAIQFRCHGGPEVLEQVELPDPVPGPGQLAIETAAVGVNFADLLMVQGNYPGMRAPMIPGLEAAGTVVAVGPGVTRYAPGHRVMGLCRGGSYATRCLLGQDVTTPVPGTFSLTEAGAFMETFVTAWHALLTVGRAVPGETALVMAAAGGVGTSLLQLAQATGVKVIAAAGSTAKLEQIKALATGGTINYREENLSERVRELTAGRGVDVVLESVGGDLAESAFSTLAPLGRMVVYGAASGSFLNIPSEKLLGRSVTIAGFTVGLLLARCPEAMAQAIVGLMGHVSQGRLRPVVGRTLPLAEARAAHELMLARETVGKIVLTVS
jgi:NADPH2:quinone reductase